MTAIALLSTLLACTGSSVNDPPSDRGDPTPPPTDTGATGETGLPPGEISAACEPTDNPLRVRCTVTVDPPQPVRIRAAATAGGGRERVHESATSAAEHDLVLSLLTAETAYTFTAEGLGGGGASVTGTFTTGAPHPMVTGAHLEVTGTSSVPYVGTHLPCDHRAVAVIFDTATGELVWYAELDPGGTLGFLDMVRFTDRRTVLGETGGRIVEVDLAGNVLRDLAYGVDYDEPLHHDLFERDGYVYVLFEDPAGTVLLDGFLVFDPTGKQVAEWRARDALAIPPGAEGDWMHTNSIYVDEAGDVYLSTLTQNTVLKIAGDWTAPDFGELEWALAGAEPAGFGQDFAVDWSKVDADGFVRQHHLSRLADGRLVMLDNEHGRGLVLSVDEQARTARAEAEYPTTGVCGPQGTAAMASNGNVFVGCSEGALTEYTASGQEVWEGRVECEMPLASARWYPLEGW